jgi:hypothetical protein
MVAGSIIARASSLVKGSAMAQMPWTIVAVELGEVREAYVSSGHARLWMTSNVLRFRGGYIIVRSGMQFRHSIMISTLWRRAFEGCDFGDRSWS